MMSYQMQAQPQELQAPPQQQSFKLFIGNIPSTMTDNALRETFQAFGPIIEHVIIRERATGNSKGYGFVKFASQESADAAIETLNGKLKFEGHSREMIVRYAGVREDEEQEYKLYVANLSRSATEQTVRRLFEPFGIVKEVYIMVDPRTQLCKGTAFVKYERRDDAERAIRSLHQRHQEDGQFNKLDVSFAHTKEEKQVIASRNQSMYGNMRAPQYGMPNTQQMQMSMPPMGGMSMPMAPNQYGMPPMTMPMHSGAGLMDPYRASSANVPSPSPYSGYATQTTPACPVPRDVRGPDGCNLFVYNVPETYTDYDLYVLFQPFGNLISCGVQRDPSSGRSKGFGFISYDNPTSASSAIASMDGYVIGAKRLSVKHKTAGKAASAFRPY